jgi:hypothetical protein
MDGMSLLRLVTLLVMLLAPSVALACTCMWAGPFTKVALGTDLVVLAEVRSHDRTSMNVTVLDLHKGTERRRLIRVWGGDGAACRPSVTAFPPGTRWILALRRFGDPHPRDYGISYCGEFWLEVRGTDAVGRISVADHGQIQESAPLAAVLAWIRSGGTAPLAPVTIR